MRIALISDTHELHRELGVPAGHMLVRGGTSPSARSAVPVPPLRHLARGRGLCDSGCGWLGIAREKGRKGSGAAANGTQERRLLRSMAPVSGGS